VAVDGTVCVVGREGDLTRRVSVSPDFPAVRTNDMTVDGAGRMLVGLFTEDRVSARGGVVAVDLVQGSVVPVATGYVTANGLAVTPDGDVLYAVDTARGSLRRHRLGEAADGGAEVVQYAGPGVLDGLALGPDGDLWVAVWDAGELHRYEASGRLRMTVAVPVARPSAVAIASLEGADHLVVTTARSQRATDVPLAPSPEGRLYATPLPD
jgi:sugar lactone lactonase YvrE